MAKTKNPVGRPPKKKPVGRPPKNPVGRPKRDIDLHELVKICRLNCTMPEIAAFLDMPLRSLEDRFTNDKEVREAIQRGRELGKLSVRRKQIQIMDETGSATMAIWLGKQLLGQRDKHDIVTEDKSDSVLDEAVSMFETLLKGKKNK